MSAARGGLRTYASIVGHGPAVRPFAAAVLARLPISMAPLGIVLLVQHVQGSYGAAGTVTAGFAVGTAVGSPVWGRAMDRLGQSRVITPTVLVSAGLLAALALGAVAGGGVPVLVVLAVGSGLSFPPFSAAMRASWRVVLQDPATLRAGYALDAATVELLFVVGPLLLSLLLVVMPPAGPLLVTAGVLAAGGLLYAASGPARQRASRTPDLDEASPVEGRPAARMVAAGLVAVLVVALAMAIAFGTIDTSLAATARTLLADESRLGVLFAAIAGGSTLGGLAYGTTSGADTEHRRLPVLLGVFCAGLVGLALLLVLSGPQGRPPMWALLPLLFVVGLSIAPSLIIQQNLVDLLAPSGRLSEAQAWLSTAVTSGGAAGTAVAGFLIDGIAVQAAFVGGAVALGGAVVVAAGSQRSWAALSPVGART